MELAKNFGNNGIAGSFAMREPVLPQGEISSVLEQAGHVLTFNQSDSAVTVPPLQEGHTGQFANTARLESL
ncbi:hypothetical protein D3C80_1964500 [compost metagenome]